MKSITAYTAPTPDNGDYVPYISVNRAGEHQELVKVTMRQGGEGRAGCALMNVTMTKPEFALFLVEALRNL